MKQQPRLSAEETLREDVRDKERALSFYSDPGRPGAYTSPTPVSTSAWLRDFLVERDTVSFLLRQQVLVILARWNLV